MHWLCDSSAASRWCSFGFNLSFWFEVVWSMFRLANVADVIRGRWLKWLLPSLLWGGRLVRKVLRNSRLSLASIRSCAPVKIKKAGCLCGCCQLCAAKLGLQDGANDPLKLSHASSRLVPLAVATGVSLRSLAFDSCWVCSSSRLFCYWA
ncbi:MAG: hypothetical protein ACKESB_00455 [Candidatus Hodgkinia cicadicola]